MSDVLLLTGFPAAGKYTVATALVDALNARSIDARLIDNHYVANPVFGVIAQDGVSPLPPGVWPLVRQVREAVLTAIEEFAPRDAVFVFTNYVREAEDDDGSASRYVDRLRDIARSRDGRFLHAALSCDPDEQLRRIASPDRARRMKSLSPEWLRTLFTEQRPWEPPGHFGSM